MITLFFFFNFLDDYTRVCLSDVGDKGSDYINANYVDVSNNLRIKKWISCLN